MECSAQGKSSVQNLNSKPSILGRCGIASHGRISSFCHLKYSDRFLSRITGGKGTWAILCSTFQNEDHKGLPVNNCQQFSCQHQLRQLVSVCLFIKLPITPSQKWIKAVRTGDPRSENQEWTLSPHYQVWSTEQVTLPFQASVSASQFLKQMVKQLLHIS